MYWIKKGLFGRIKESAIGDSSLVIKIELGPQTQKVLSEALRLWEMELDERRIVIGPEIPPDTGPR